MYKIITLLLNFIFVATLSFCQSNVKVDSLISEGIALYDKGEYPEAIRFYDQALSLDKDNLVGLSEKALTLLAQGNNKEAIDYCKKAIKKGLNNEALISVYVTYGNALDALKKSKDALNIYDEGIKKFPNQNQIYFNKGITLSGLGKIEDAILCMQKAVQYNPRHGSSHNALAQLEKSKPNRIPALLAFARFLVIEPEGKRAAANLESMLTIMNGNAEKTGENSITLNFSPDMIDTKGKSKENNFQSVDLILTMSAGLDLDDKYKNNTPVEKFIRKFETVCSSLSETQKDNSGFYWEYYAPYFIEMKQKKMITTFAYLAFASTPGEDIDKWFKENKADVKAFFDWSKNFAWSADKK
jgi:Tfp pilus assembly protein PilF